jgi:thiol-disulfide isomerase/thioredoxin
MSGVIVLHFWSPTCGPCKVIKPALEDLKEEFADQIQEWVSINTKEDPKGIARKFGVAVSSQPSFSLRTTWRLDVTLVVRLVFITLSSARHVLLKHLGISTSHLGNPSSR